MKYLVLLFSVVLFAACGGEATEHAESSTIDTVSNVDSVQQQEEDEMAEEIIEGSFDALNR